MSKVTFITATYNKAQMLAEAAKSVFAQTSSEWVWWILLNEADAQTEAVALRIASMDSRVKLIDFPIVESERYKIYYPAVISNHFFKKVTTPYFTWFSDDDLLEPCFVEVLAGALDADPSKDIVYGHCRIIRGNQFIAMLGANTVFGKTTGIWPDCKIDSGQTLQTKRSYDSLGNYKIPTTWDHANHVDGIYMNHLAQRFPFWPIDRLVLTHRYSPLSAFGK